MKWILRSAVVGAVLWGAILPVFSGRVESQKAGNLPLTPPAPGQVIEKVVCEGSPDESYALYLPSNYTPSKRWPIIYAFDPGARGRTHQREERIRAIHGAAHHDPQAHASQTARG
jgi:hypothetical protein